MLAGVVGLLALATLLIGALRLRYPDDPVLERRWRSLGTWWLLALLLVAALALGRPAVVLLTLAASLLVLHEGLRLAASPGLYPALAAFTVGVYLWAWLDPGMLFGRAVPVLAALLAVGEVAWRTVLRHRLAGLRALVQVLLLAVVGPVHVVGVAALPAAPGLPRGSLGWLLLLLVLTELNDIAQAWCGRAFGSRPLAPRLSPAKTWEGVVGGLVTTAGVVVALAPVLTSYGRPGASGPVQDLPPWMVSLLLGVTVAVAGVAGDLAASALKRRAGVKDSGDLLPGHGGVLDRLDSLALTAPAFLHLTALSGVAGP